MGGEVPAEVLTDPAVASGAHQLIRSDLLLSQSFINATRDLVIPGDLHVLGGESDGSLLEPNAWARHSTGSCTVRLLPGGHLLSAANPRGVAAAVLTLLADV